MVAAGLYAGPADATTMFSSLSAWTAAAGGVVLGVDLSGPEGSCDSQGVCNEITVPTFNTPSGVTLTQGGSQDFFRANVPDTWSAWSNGSQPFVLANFSDNQLILNLSANLPAFGFELEPNVFDIFNMKVTLSDGSTLTQAVDGDGGAEFFGWVGATDLTSITINCDAGCSGFAIGNMVEAVPEPESVSLFGAGLIGLAAWRRRHLRAA